MPPRPSLLAAAALLFAGLALPAVASAGDDPYGDIAPKKETTRLAVAPADGGDLLQLLQPIRFTTGSTTIATISTLVIQDVAAVLKDHAEWTKVEIGGHTDSVGRAEKNLELSQGRAEAVLEALVGHGLARERLSAKGFGETKPLVQASDELGHARNRRVEFRVSGTPPVESAEPKPQD